MTVQAQRVLLGQVGAEVLVKVVPRGDSRVAALETGDLDRSSGPAVMGLPRSAFEAFCCSEATGGFETGVSTLWATQPWPSTQGAGRGLRVRRAVQHAIDRDAIIRACSWRWSPAPFLSSTAMPYCDAGPLPTSTI